MLTSLSRQIQNHNLVRNLPIMIRRWRAVEMLLLRRITSSKLDTVRPGWPWSAVSSHHHIQQRFILNIVRCPVLDTLRRHNVLAVTNGQLSLPFSCIMRLPYTLLMPSTTTTATLVPRPMRLCSKNSLLNGCLVAR